MLRNDLIVLLSQYDNDTVTVDVRGIMIDIESVGTDRDSLVLHLHRDDVHSVMQNAARKSRDPK
ncbi:hypothetical protein [Actinoplanes sp. NPDC051859]|uniref:hypothetical protein n=1 Tax=Actinoplanes sp. NPDC051859 TaxID=3363909 RepID=UPI0037A56996